ncbi:MAG: phospholipase D family protein [Proteobacteria bacterium]|nr:phospholipase D family protein [Pseudomonadota bacterium]
MLTVVRTLLLVLALLLGLLLVTALLSRRALPPRGPVAQSEARTGLADTTLARSLAAEIAAHPGLSGIHPLADGHDAFAARAALADAAERRIDAQYYIWHNDTAGRLLLQHLRRAADRGVHVRLLLDDNNTAGLDPLLRGLDAHPQIEVRLFNPLMHRRLRVLNYLSDFNRAHRRMHNKSFTVDGQVTVVGGRNVGDEYFGAGAGVMFADLDVSAIGPVVAAVEADFERYWTSPSAYPLTAIVTDPEQVDVGTVPADDAATQRYRVTIANSSLVRHLHAGSLPLVWAPTRLVSDDPAKVLGQVADDDTLMAPLFQAMESARHELTIISPYFVPTQVGTDALTQLAASGVKVEVLTNALSATDVAAVHTGYARYREALLRGGVKLYELKRSATVVASGHGGVTGSSGASLHAKTFTVDGHQIFVGSFNMDPRSARLNTEMGLLIDSAELADQLQSGLAAMAGTAAYAVTLEQGHLRWTTQEGGQTVTEDSEPQTSWWRHLSVQVMSWLPIEWLL